MLRKLDKLCGLIWFCFLPLLISPCVIICAICLYRNLDDEAASLWLNIGCVLSVLILSGWGFTLLLSTITGIKDFFYGKYLDKHPEKCTTKEQLAEDFEKLAKILREEDKDK